MEQHERVQTPGTAPKGIILSVDDGYIRLGLVGLRVGLCSCCVGDRVLLGRYSAASQIEGLRRERHHEGFVDVLTLASACGCHPTPSVGAKLNHKVVR